MTSFRYTGGIGGRSSVGRARASQSAVASNRRKWWQPKRRRQAKSGEQPSGGFAPVCGRPFAVCSQNQFERGFWRGWISG